LTITSLAGKSQDTAKIWLYFGMGLANFWQRFLAQQGFGVTEFKVEVNARCEETAKRKATNESEEILQA